MPNYAIIKVSIFGWILAVCMGWYHNAPDKPPRLKENFDFDWKFSKGDFPDAFQKNFDDKVWENIDLPHDWAISDAFSKDYPTGNSGGFATGAVGWYRKHFTLDNKDKDSEISIEFGGVYENSEVWINRHYLGKRPYGYAIFIFTNGLRKILQNWSGAEVTTNIK